MIDAQNLIQQNKQLAYELKQRIDQLAAIGTVAATVSQSLDLDKTLSTALQAVLDIMGAEAGGISLIDEKAGEVVLRAQQGWTHDFVKASPMRIPLGQGMSGRVIANDNLVVVNDLNRDEQLAVPSFHDEQFRSIAMAPMHARGKIVGILSIMSSHPYQFSEEMVGVLRAIADTVGVALDNARLYEASLENQSQLSAILHSTADGIIATDQSGHIRVINQTAEGMLGLTGRSLIGMPLREVSIDPKMRHSLLVALAARTEDYHRMFKTALDDGRVLSVLVSPIYVACQVHQISETDGWVIVLQDVTHLHQAEVARTQFIQAAAHDMRNPLGAALNSLYMLQTMMEDNDNARELVDIASLGISRTQELIDDLLNLERIENGYGFDLTEVYIGDLIDEVSIEIRPTLDKRDLVYTVEVGPDISTVRVDRKWLIRAMLNYLENACKYTPRGGNVRLCVYAKAGLLHIEVTDDGPGIPFEVQPRLFERFYRVNGNVDVPGTGLGLAIVKSVAEQHGGNVYVHSHLGSGSTFGMTLLLDGTP